MTSDPVDEAELLALLEPRQFEDSYQKLGWHKGPFGAREVQGTARRFWLGKGAEGAAWLLERIHDEHSVDVLDTVAEIVGDCGRTDEAATAACLDVLESDPSEEQEQVALTAIRWMAVPSTESLITRLCATIERYLRQASAELQEKAVLATRALPDDMAEELLAAVHGDVEEAIRDLIDEERVHSVLRT